MYDYGEDRTLSTGRKSGPAGAAPLDDEHIQVLVRRLDNRVRDLRAALDLLNGDVQDALGMIETDLKLLKQAHAKRRGRIATPARRSTTAPETRDRANGAARKPSAAPVGWPEGTTTPGRTAKQAAQARPSVPSAKASQPPVPEQDSPLPARESTAEASRPAPSAPARPSPAPSKSAPAPRASESPKEKPPAEVRRSRPKKELNDELADLFERSAWDDAGEEVEQLEYGTPFETQPRSAGAAGSAGGEASGDSPKNVDSLLSGYLDEKK